MAKSIITYSGDVVNYDNLISVGVEPVVVESEDSTAEAYGVVGYDINNTKILLFHAPDIETVTERQEKLVAWLQSESFATFNVMEGAENGY